MTLDYEVQNTNFSDLLSFESYIKDTSRREPTLRIMFVATPCQ